VRPLAVVLVGLALLPAFGNSAFAHPLGNFTVNRLSIVTVARDAIRVRYILDLAEATRLSPEVSLGASTRAMVLLMLAAKAAAARLTQVMAVELRERDPKKLIPPLHGALLKNEQDVHLFERLAFMARREAR